MVALFRQPSFRNRIVGALVAYVFAIQGVLGAVAGAEITASTVAAGTLTAICHGGDFASPATPAQENKIHDEDCCAACVIGGWATLPPPPSIYDNIYQRAAGTLSPQRPTRFVKNYYARTGLSRAPPMA